MDLSRFQSLDIILICGLPGSGKSYFAKTYFKNSERKRINRKEIRRLIFEMTTFGEHWKEEYYDEHDESLVKHVERKILEHLLQNKQKVLIDNTSISSESRKTYLSLAKQMNKSIGAIFLNAPLAKCLERNRNREDAVPENAITNLSVAIQIPSKEEGFKDALTISFS